MMEVAHDLGATATKIVGSGGGGCFVALAPKERETSIITALAKTTIKQAFAVQITALEND